MLAVTEYKSGIDGEVQRVVKLDGDPVLDIRIDNLRPDGFPAPGTRAEAVITWPVTRTNLRSHIQAAQEVFLGYQRDTYPIRIEARIDGIFHQDDFGLGQSLTNNTLGFIASKRFTRGQSLELLLLAAGDLAIEWLFEPNDPNEIAISTSCMCTLICAKYLAKFCRGLHADSRITNQGEITREIFANDGTPQLNAFGPLQVVEV